MMGKFNVFAMASVAILGLASCGAGGVQSAPVNEELVEEAMEVKGQDLAFFDLKGDVKSCTLVNNGNKETYTFDENGNCTSFTKDYTEIVSTERDDEGRIVCVNAKDPMGREYAEVYEYDEKGRIAKVSCDAEPDGMAFEHIYSYDGNGRVVLVKGWNDGPGNLEFRYKYISEDEQGNWTKREKSVVLEEEEPNVEIEERVIKY